MRLGPFGIWEILIVLVVIVLLFGARRLPDFAKGVGQSVRAFRDEMRGMRDDIERDDAAERAPERAPADRPPTGS